MNQLPATIQSHERQVSELRAKLDERPSQDELRGALKALFGAFPADKPASETVLAYVMALQDLPLWAVQGAVGSFLRGIVPGNDGKWMPTAPQVAIEARRLAAPTVRELQRAIEHRNRAQEALDEERRKPTPEERQRGEELWQAVKREMDKCLAETALTERESSASRSQRYDACKRRVAAPVVQEAAE